MPGFLFGENVALIKYIIQFLCLVFCLGKMLLLYNTLYCSCAWVFVWGKCCSCTIQYTILVPGFLFGENVALIQYIMQFLCLGFCLGKMFLLYNTLYSSCAWVFVWGKSCSYTIHYAILVPGFLFGENVALIQYIIQFLCLGFGLGKMLLLYNTLYNSCAWVFVWGKCCSYTIHYTVLVPGFLSGEMLLLYNTFYNSCAWVFVWGKCCSYTIHYTVLVPGFWFGENVALIQYIIQFLCLGFCLGKMLLLYNTLYNSCAWVFVWGKCCSYTIHYTVLVPGFWFGENVALIQHIIQFLCLGFCLGKCCSTIDSSVQDLLSSRVGGQLLHLIFGAPHPRSLGRRNCFARQHRSGTFAILGAFKGTPQQAHNVCACPSRAPPNKNPTMVRSPLASSIHGAKCYVHRSRPRMVSKRNRTYTEEQRFLGCAEIFAAALETKG